MSPAVLTLIDGQGEVSTQEEVCEACRTKDQTIERLTRSYEGTILNLRKELKALQPAKFSEQAQEVFDHWADTVLECGFWSRAPRFSDSRRKVIEKRLDQGYSVAYLSVVIDSIRLQEGVKQAWIDLPSLLSDGNGSRWDLEARYEDALQRLYVRPAA